MPKPDALCLGCGKQVRRGKRHCQECAVPLARQHFDAGREMAQSPTSLAKRSITQRLQKQAIRNWEASDLPAWLTREVYSKEILPALASIAKSRIRSALGVSEMYASDIRSGRRTPHARHWQTLAELVGISGST
jgi:hypothetical protein